jgi:hypothetical protein
MEAPREETPLATTQELFRLLLAWKTYRVVNINASIFYSA